MMSKHGAATRGSGRLAEWPVIASECPETGENSVRPMLPSLEQDCTVLQVKPTRRSAQDCIVTVTHPLYTFQTQPQPLSAQQVNQSGSPNLRRPSLSLRIKSRHADLRHLVQPSPKPCRH